MDSKTHILLFLSTLLLFHSHPTTATCVQRSYTHMIHSLLQPPSSSNPPSTASTLSVQPQQPQQQQPSLASSTEEASSSTTEESHHPSGGSLVPKLAGALHVKLPGNLDAAIKGACAKTDYADLCLSSIGNSQITSGPVDVHAILQLAIKAVMRHANVGLSEAKKLANDPSLPPFTAKNMKVCQDTYSSAMDNLQNAAQAAVAGDIGTLKTMLSAAMTDYETCSDGFVEMPGASPLSEYDEKLSHMVSNCLAISSELK